MLAKKGKNQKTEKMIEKNKAKETQQKAIKKGQDDMKLKQNNQSNVKGIKGILKTPEQSPVKSLIKKSSKKHLQIDEIQTISDKSQRTKLSKHKEPTQNKGIKNESKKMEVEKKSKVKMEIEQEIALMQIKQQSYHGNSNNAGLKLQQSKHFQQQEDQQSIDFDFVEIIGITMNKDQQMQYKVLLKNPKTNEEISAVWNKHDFVPVCRKKKINLIYYYYIKLMTYWGMQKQK